MTMENNSSLYDSVIRATSVEKHKFVLLGDANTGKTSIINRFMYNNYDPAYQSTIGIDFVSKTCYLGERTIRMQLWDTAGQERFRSLIPSYIRDSTVAILVYDITNLSSFESIESWYSHVREQKNDILTILVGNKSDLEDDRRISTEEGEKKATSINSLFIETSAKSGLNIDVMFQKIMNLIPKEDVQNSNNCDRYLRITPEEAKVQSTSCNCFHVCYQTVH